MGRGVPSAAVVEGLLEGLYQSELHLRLRLFHDRLHHLGQGVGLKDWGFKVKLWGVGIRD